MGESGVQAIIAAVILGVCMLAGAYLISGSLDRGAEMIPVVEVDSRQIGDGRPGPVTRELKKKFEEYAHS